jgi:hypothetical protein
MKINVKKTKFMVINGSKQDNRTLHVESSNGLLKCDIDLCKQYTYLGSIFTGDGKVLTAVHEHVRSKQKHLLKLVSFLRKNHDMPFRVKKKVFNACFMASIVYASESWLNVNLKAVDKLYLGAIKALLNVRSTTCHELCLIELGLPRLSAFVKQRQREFFSKIRTTRHALVDDPLMYVLDLITRENSPTAKYIDNLSAGNINFVSDSHKELRDTVQQKADTRSKMAAYLIINPNLVTPNLYALDLEEYKRIPITRLRLIAHNLRIETGRWSRIPREERLCPCGEDIQTEQHILEYCSLSQTIRQKYALDFRIEVITDCGGPDAANAVHETLKCFE